MVEVRKREHESTGSLLRRFTKRMQTSGFLLRARKLRFRQRLKSDYKKRKEALHKIEARNKYERLHKLGKV
jgi:ribosomal protein S21